MCWYYNVLHYGSFWRSLYYVVFCRSQKGCHGGTSIWLPSGNNVERVRTKATGWFNCAYNSQTLQWHKFVNAIVKALALKYEGFLGVFRNRNHDWSTMITNYCHHMFYNPHLFLTSRRVIFQKLTVCGCPQEEVSIPRLWNLEIRYWWNSKVAVFLLMTPLILISNM